MRRLIHSHFGRAVSFLVTFALLLPAFTLITARKAEAQVETQPAMAVLEFADVSKVPNKIPGLGKTAATALRAELEKTNKYDVLSEDTVNRSMGDLGFQPPVTRVEDQIRLGQQAQAVTVTSGTINNYRVVDQGGGKVGQVLMRIEIRDVASGLVINGAALSASSSVRVGDITPEALINEAIAAGMFNAVREIQSRTLSSATVLNTLDNTALINQGERVGFKKGQEVVVTRGREQVAIASVTDLEPDSAFIRVTRGLKGMQPGDRVRVIFSVPEVKGDFGKGGSAQVQGKKSRGNNTALIAALLIIGLVAILLSSGRSDSTAVINNFTAQAELDFTNVDVNGGAGPAVRLRWSPEQFFTGGNAQRFAYQIWRNDVPNTPILIVDGGQTEAVDRNDGRSFNWYNFGGLIGGTTCQFSEPPSEGPVSPAPLVAGTQYQYSIELVYKLSQLDLPGSGGSTGGGTGTTGLSTGGSTGGTTTSTGSTGGLTIGRDVVEMLASTTGGRETTGGTTGSTSGEAGECYFATARVAGPTVTPLAQPVLRSPDDGAKLDVSVPRTFQFISAKARAGGAIVEYVLQISTDPTFPSDRSIFAGEPLRDGAGPNALLSTQPVDLRTVFAQFPGAKELWWRIGAKSVSDPTPPTGGYIFSNPRRFGPATLH
ncbi:MAG: hypothetical protein HONBIEJF_00732 [Fimbriimonadaceae bacterium]|nr:hypothetical protein [Fimbriimonadaceae bacterium]